MTKQIFEELSISDEIKSEAENLAKVILMDSKIKAEIIKKNGFDNVLKNEFIIKLFGVNYNIIYYIYSINNISEFDIKLFKNLISITKNNENEIILNLLFVSNNPDSEYFYSQIYHELTHVYQYIKSKNDVLKNTKIKNLYDLIKDIKYSSQSELNILFTNAIYACFDFEQDALLHETYCEYMKSYQIYHLNFDIEDSNAYKFIEDLRNAIEHINELDEKLFKNSQEFYLNLFTEKLKRFETKFGKLITKIKKEFYEKHLNEGLVGNFRAFTLIIKDDSSEINNYIDDEIF